jgi:nucleoside-diphosphate-sugar epimerase
MTHLVLGGNGVIGRATISALTDQGLEVRSISRMISDPTSSSSMSVDLRDTAATRQALKGASAAYLVLGLPYRTSAWRRDWPPIVQNVIDACVRNDTTLVFLDNVYAYGAVDGPMTEKTPIRPTSAKGRVRAGLLTQLHEAAEHRGLRLTVGRSADFYGPGAHTSVFNSFALANIAKGKKPLWLFDAHQPHSMTYTPDIARALTTLGTDPRAIGRSWHLPTAPALSGADYIAIATGSARPKFSTLSVSTVAIAAMFSADARESLELRYQSTRPYLFDSSSFETTFGLLPTPYQEGIPTSLAAEPVSR